MAGVSFEHRVEDGGRHLAAWVRAAGDDLVVVVGGGERPHVGCVVLALPQPSRTSPGAWTPSVSLLTVPCHKEEPIARGVAEAIVRATGRTTVVTAGVHDDGLDRAGVEAYLALGRRLATELAARLATSDRA